jgi:hypothetical protein
LRAFDSPVSGLVPVAGSYEHDNVLSGFVKDGIFLTGWVTTLKNGFAVWSLFEMNTKAGRNLHTHTEEDSDGQQRKQGMK